MRTSFLLLCALPTAQAFAGGLTPKDLASLARLSDPQVSPDGSSVVYVLRETDLDANRGRTDLWLLDLDETDAEPRRLTAHAENDAAPQWSADGAWIYFISGRSGSDQVWRISASGGEATQVTDFAVDVANLLVPPRGNRIAFTARVFADCENLACTRERLDRASESQRDGMLFDRLFVRHWDTWMDGRRSALYTVAVDEHGRAAGEPIKVSGDLDGDVPSVPFGGREEIAFSADGETLFFALREAGTTEPRSTNLDIFRVPADGSAAPENLTADNDAADTHPIVSPDGRLLAWTAMRRAGYESDRLEVMLRDLRSGATRSLTAGWDRSVGDFVFAADGRTLYATANHLGTTPLFAIDADTGAVRQLTEGLSAAAPQVANGRLIYVRDSLAAPADLYSLALAGGEPKRLTAVNADALGGVELADYEQFSFAGAGGDTVYGYAMRPVGLRRGARYPIAFLIHGGPQGSFGEGWSYRWNPQTYAALGYGVVMVDFHGSTGYGQHFTDAINRDWGGKPLEDLQRGLAAAIERFPWLDGDKACALGASYGGYMVNWIAGNWPDRFRCLVNHAGLFDLRSFYYATEELWFPEWDMGAAYYEDPEAYERFNPATRVREWRTPMLVTHGANDFRVPVEQALGAFTALQRRGIPSRLLIFPDENHWVLSPASSIQWHETVAAWLAEHLQSGSR